MTINRNRARSRFAKDCAGATAVEFALVLPAFIFLVFGIFQFGYLLFMGASVQWATDKAARLAIIDSDVSVEDVEAKILSYISGGEPDIEVTLTTTLVGAVSVLRVTTLYSHKVEGPLLPSFVVPFSFETVVPVPEY